MKILKVFTSHLILPFALLIALSSVANAALLITDNNQLIGADGIEVDGNFFDVRFIDSTCADIFGVCSSANFTFQGQTEGFLAAAALRDQIFSTVSGAPYDIDPELIFGCTSTITCQILIPVSIFAGSLLTSAIVNNSDGVGITGIGSTRTGSTGENLANSASLVYASFTPSTAVNVPSTIGLLVIACLGVLARRRPTFSQQRKTRS